MGEIKLQGKRFLESLSGDKKIGVFQAVNVMHPGQVDICGKGEKIDNGRNKTKSPCDSDSERFSLIVHQKQLLLASPFHPTQTGNYDRNFTAVLQTHRHRNDKPPFVSKLL